MGPATWTARAIFAIFRNLAIFEGFDSKFGQILTENPNFGFSAKTGQNARILRIQNPGFWTT